MNFPPAKNDTRELDTDKKDMTSFWNESQP